MRWSILMVLGGCGVGELSIEVMEDEGATAQQKERWSSQDSPFLFSPDLETRLDALPASGEAAQIPWTGHYWPVSADTINFRWAGAASDSAAKKYERAFEGSGVEDAVSRANGIDGTTGQRSCASDAECSAARGEVCAKRPGRANGRCIPTWWGICHGWGPAAISWPEPKTAVTRNGVRFEVPDLKALASLVHERTRTKFVALRCETGAPAFAFDRYGRPTGGDCRDTNAGTYHVLIANYLGRFRQSFMIDRVVDDEVWNQPLRSFRVLSRRELTAAEANALVGVTGATYRFNPDARRLVQIEAEVKWIAGSEAAGGYVGSRIDLYTRADRYAYVLELDAAGKIIGGEWARSSKTSHPDFAWLPVGVAGPSVAGGAITYEQVRQLVLESATSSTGAAAPPADALVLPAGSWRTMGPFTAGEGTFAVELLGTGDADLYVRVGGPPSSALFDCRPYLSTSRESCAVRGPGQVWVAVHAATAATVTLRTRFTAGVAPARLSTSGTVKAGEMKVYAVTVTAGRAVVVRTSAANDVDLYVRLGSPPTTGAYDARGYTPTGNEVVRVVPRASGQLVLGVRGYSSSAFTLSAEEQP